MTGGAVRAPVRSVFLLNPDLSPALMRAPDWPALFEAELAAWRARAFAWGFADCLAFCRATGRAICGADPLGDVPLYVSERDVIKKMRARGFATAVDFIGAHIPEIAPASARRGDWVFVPTQSALGCAFGVITGRRAAHMGLEGLVALDASVAQRAWRVGL
jgi:hypothetical protein